MGSWNPDVWGELPFPLLISLLGIWPKEMARKTRLSTKQRPLGGEWEEVVLGLEQVGAARRQAPSQQTGCAVSRLREAAAPLAHLAQL